SRTVRDALIWLGESDPCETMARARLQDPKTQALAEVLAQWHAVIGENSVSVKRVIEYATQTSGGSAYDMGLPVMVNADFREALLVVAGDRGAISSLRLGKWLARTKNRIVAGLRIEQDMTGDHGGVARWKVVQS
ncbi:MAG TPA: hypothetical protein VHY35_01640, partial [Stellaceae bacterium]|nr:hypothetical protein [Stellaceae bacterium]